MFGYLNSFLSSKLIFHSLQGTCGSRIKILHSVSGPDDGEEPKGRKKGKDVEAGEMQEDEDEEEGGEEEGADAEKRRGQDNDERGYDDDVDDDEMEIAEKTKEKDLKEQVRPSCSFWNSLSFVCFF